MKKQKIIGKCKSCGGCCKNIQLDSCLDSQHKEFIRTDFNKIIKGAIGVHLKDNPHLNISECHRITFSLINDRTFCFINGVECNKVIQEGKRFLCGIHEDKPTICKDYPCNDSMVFKGCGYKKITIKEKKVTTKQKIKQLKEQIKELRQKKSGKKK